MGPDVQHAYVTLSRPLPSWQTRPPLQPSIFIPSPLPTPASLPPSPPSLPPVGVRCKSVTLKVKRRQAGAGAPWKMLGHGPCDNLSRQVGGGGDVGGKGTRVMVGVGGELD